MKLATVRQGAATAAVRLDGDELVEVGASDVGQLLRRPDWQEWSRAESGARSPAADADFAPLIPRPEKIICVGLNYRSHIVETGREIPEYPTLFAKFTSTLIGAHDDIVLPAVSDTVDWEAELAVIIGTPVRHATEEVAVGAIAGFSVLNDISVRDYQTRTVQWLQGKTFESTTPLGPYLATRDDPDGVTIEREIVCEVDGSPMQKSSTRDLLFGPAALVAYISRILTLQPGDVIATGTPGGVGFAMSPPVFLEDGNVVVTRIAGVGECRNTCRREPQPR